MTLEERIAKALGDSQLETIAAAREAGERIESAVLDLRARLAEIEHQRLRRVEDALADEGGNGA